MSLSKFKILCPLTKLDSSLASLNEHYIKCAKPFGQIRLQTIKPSKASGTRALDEEADSLLMACQKNDKIIALTEKGQALSSTKLATQIAKWPSHNLNFIIGSACGLSPKILQRADLELSLSPMTFPHQLAIVMLCEQLYRSLTILNNHPYHRE